jgi:hypothetical protein
MTKMFKHFSEYFLLCWVYLIPTYVCQLPPPLADKSVSQHGLLPLFISSIPITSQRLVAAGNKSKRTMAGNWQGKRTVAVL